jgi:hypothetical protein
MVLISSSYEAIPAEHRLLGDHNLKGAYVRIRDNTYVHIGSVRDSVQRAYLRNQIHGDEFQHYAMICAAIYNGYYFDDRYHVAALDDPFVKMNVVTWLELYGDKFEMTDETAWMLFEDDLVMLEAIDHELNIGLHGVDLMEMIPDEYYRPDVVEIVDLTAESDDSFDFDIDGLVLDIENDDWSISTLGSITNSN